MNTNTWRPEVDLSQHLGGLSAPVQAWCVESVNVLWDMHIARIDAKNSGCVIKDRRFHSAYVELVDLFKRALV